MGVMFMSKNALTEIKSTLEEHIGKRIYLKANSGRRKIVERFGVLEKTYPSVFVIRLDKEQHSFDRVSYSYADILTQAIELVIYEEDNKLPLRYVKTS